MAVVSSKVLSQLQIKYNNGQNVDGTPKVDSQKIKVNKDVTDEKLFEFGKLISGILVSPATEIGKIENSGLLQE
ncbi:MAG: DUF1659 domain-containing protein [Clostridium sp.]|nr:DUF1659 domain-containing protein [Clostridium sp.]